MSKYGIISGPYFPILIPNRGKYRPEITPYLDTFHVALLFNIFKLFSQFYSMHHIKKYLCCLETATKISLQKLLKIIIRFPRENLVFESIFSATFPSLLKKEAITIV